MQKMSKAPNIEQTIQNQLNELAQLRRERADISGLAVLEEARDLLNRQIALLTAPIDLEIDELESRIKANTIFIETTVRGESLMAVYTPGRITWANGVMLKIAESNPAVDACKRVGRPSASIRVVKK